MIETKFHSCNLILQICIVCLIVCALPILNKPEKICAEGEHFKKQWNWYQTSANSVQKFFYIRYGFLNVKFLMSIWDKKTPNILGLLGQIQTHLVKSGAIWAFLRIWTRHEDDGPSMMVHHWWPSIFRKKPWWPSHF